MTWVESVVSETEMQSKHESSLCIVLAQIAQFWWITEWETL